ncbi:hypothetical protein BB560_001246 [Smittium megazygosporum]|uniref:Transmembrane protein 209 n=1 Tax=Smittium megazygosporum TaxID=133381 RepID=A0A2T9ZIC5_9FUNG|nr:hypothetical protein BB560_001246 [Smittium megazygosporum]
MYFQNLFPNLIAILLLKFIFSTYTFQEYKRLFSHNAILNLTVLEYSLLILLCLNLIEILYHSFTPRIHAPPPTPSSKSILKSSHDRYSLTKNLHESSFKTPIVSPSASSRIRNRLSALDSSQKTSFLSSKPLLTPTRNPSAHKPQFQAANPLDNFSEFNHVLSSTLTPSKPQSTLYPKTPDNSSFLLPDLSSPVPNKSPLRTPSKTANISSSFLAGSAALRSPLHKHLFGSNASSFNLSPLPQSARSIFEESRDQYISKDFSYFSPEDVFDLFGLDTTMYKYIENCISWFSQDLVKPLAEKITSIDAIFQSHQMSHLTCSNATLDPALLSADAPSLSLTQQQSTFSQNILTNAPLSLVQLKARFPDDQYVDERIFLERYLNIKGYESSRKYIVHRIKTLASANLLVNYKWSTGGEHPDAKPWNSKTDPSDQIILFHLFCVYMDATIHSSFTGSSHPFTSQYVSRLDDKPNTNLPFQIVQVSKKPPHFCLNVKGSFYDAPSNFQNLFFTVCLMLIILKKESDFYIETTDLGRPGLGFKAIFDI